MLDSRTDQHIRRWLEGLANLTVSGTEPVTPERIALMAGFLAMDSFPLEAFCQRSLHHAAQGQRFFPAYDDVRKAVTTWWEANRKASQAQITGPSPSGMDEMDRSWEAFYRKRRAELAASSTSFEADQVAIGRLKSLVKAQSPKAWAAVSGERPSEARAPTEAEVSHVARLLRPEPPPGQPRYEVVEAPVPFRDVTAKGDELARIRGKLVERQVEVVSDREPWG